MNDFDRNFDESLRTLGRTSTMPGSMSDEVRARCLASFGPAPASSPKGVLRRPAVLSSVGLVIAVATALGLLFPTNGGPAVHAATVLEKLSKQVTGDDVIEARLDKVEVEEVAINGQVYLADAAMAGDVQVLVDEGDGEIEIDAAFGITDESGWVLLRKLRIPDKEAQVYVDLFLPRDQETLVLLPPQLVKAKLAEGLGGGLAHIREMAGGHVAEVVKSLVQSASAAGATTRKLRDGTIEMTIDLKDEATIKAFMTAVANTMGQEVEEEIEVEDHDLSELVGAVFTAVYDPDSEMVRSFSVSGVHGIKGTISVALHGGTIAPALLDSASVTQPGTRTLDLNGLLQSVDGLQKILHHD